MLQGLLAERFRLKFHREMREMQVDRLVVDKDPKLRATELTEEDPRGFTLRASARGPGFLKAKASAMSLDWLANDLSGHRSTLVVDGTGLKGLCEFDVDFEFDRADAMDSNVPVREASNHIREGLQSCKAARRLKWRCWRLTEWRGRSRTREREDALQWGT